MKRHDLVFQFPPQMVLKQQKETRTKDGRRRITPLMIASPLDLRYQAFSFLIAMYLSSGEAGLKTMVMLCMEEKVDRGLGARPQENYAQPHPIDAWKRGITPFLVQ